MQSFDPFTVAILVAAIVVLLKLRSVLGQKTGHQEDMSDLFDREKERRKTQQDGPPADNVVKLPTRGQNDNANSDEKDPRLAQIDKLAKPRTKINKGLKDILAADPGFNPKEFMAGADMAYEMIVDAFAQGDTKSLRNLLSPEVFEGFDSVIKDRESRGETVKSTFIGIDESEIQAAEVKDHEAHITIKFVSQIVSATLDKEGVIIEGDDKDIARVKDVWTFARDTRNNDPNWKLVATEAGA
jgi:predicted lipid-binding transport protein (Tim44 family)